MLRETRKRINGQYIWLYEGVSKVTKFPSFPREESLVTFDTPTSSMVEYQ